jgi:glycerol uptake facilitator-like aquaporin
MLLVAIQIVAARNDLYSNVFEIVIATIQSFLAAALASSNYFCYTAVTSSAIVLILPGYIVLSGSLELASRNITSGSVRMGYSVIYSLFLGFGIAIGAEIFRRITGKEIANDGRDWSCAITHSAGSPWYLQTVPEWWYFLIVPGYSFWLSLRQSQPLWAKELVSNRCYLACC